MQPRKKALAVAAAGTALGLAGLAVIAMPAGAGEQPPSLPDITAEDLVSSVLTADAPALSGTVTMTESLGLPVLPGAGPIELNNARVFHDGENRARISVPDGGGESTVVFDGTTVWTYNSAGNKATKVTPPAGTDPTHGGLTGEGQVADPAAIATQLLTAVRDSSNIEVDGTASVAGRDAYELVLTPKPEERTVLREIRVAVDSETRLPLRLSVLTNGTSTPALEVGFSQFAVEQQPADLFTFTPPAGATVTEKQPELPANADEQARKAQDSVAPKVVGTGWDTVITGQVPADFLAGGQLPATLPGGDQKRGERGNGDQPVDVKALLAQIAKPVSGPFGTGYVVTTKVGAALLTDDGRFAAGAVPEQVLIEALGTR